MPQELKSGADVTSLMSGQDVTDLMSGAAAKPTPNVTEQAQPSWLSQAIQFGAGALSQVNPIEALKGIYGAVSSPIQTVKGLAARQVNEFVQGKKAFDEGRYADAYGHTMAGVIPIIGPAAADIGMQIQQAQDTGQSAANAYGKATGLVGSILAPSLARPVIGKVLEAVKTSGAGEAIASPLAKAGAEMMAETLSPKVGRDKGYYAAVARKVAPRLLTEPDMGALSVGGLESKAQAGLEEAGNALDEAHATYGATDIHDTQPVVAALQQKIEDLKAPSASGPEAHAQLEKMGLAVPSEADIAGKIGQDVQPQPIRAETIQKAITEIKQLGPAAYYDSLRKIREPYDVLAKNKYVPMGTPEQNVAAEQTAQGAADVTGAIREGLATARPETVGPNRDYSFYKNVTDLTAALKRSQQSRPKVGRRMVAATGGALAGEAVGGGKLAAIGMVLGPIVDHFATMGPTYKIMTARAMGQLAQAVRTGDAAGVTAGLLRMRRINLSLMALQQGTRGRSLLAEAPSADLQDQEHP